MAIFGDRIKVACSTTGSTATTLTLGSAVSGFQTLSQGGLSNGDSVRYVIEDGSNFEIGLATYATGSPDTLTGRSDANVSASSSSNNRINLSGSSTLFIAPTAADLQTVHVYSATSDLPSATDNHGMIAHVHGEGAMYFAHGGSWVKLANYSDITTYSNATTSAAGLMSAADKTKLDGVEASANVTDTTNVVAALTAGTNITIAADGTISSTASGGGGSSTSALTETTFSASANQTAFVVSGGITNASNVSVFQNGVKLEEGSTKDYTVNASTNTVTLNSGAAASDVVEVLEFGQPNSITDLSDTPSSLGTAGQVLQVNSGATALEFGTASGGSMTVYNDINGTDGTPSGYTYLTNASSPSNGDLAFVTANNTVYVRAASGWRKIATVQEAPSTVTGHSASYPDIGQNPTTDITLSTTDPEGFDVTWSYVVGGNGTLSGSNINNSDGDTLASIAVQTANANSGGTNTITFRVTRQTTTIAGDFTITFTATDSQSTGTSDTGAISFEIAFVIAESHYTTLLAAADGSAGGNSTITYDTGSSTGNSLTANGTPYAGTFSPYRHGGYSTYFDGSGDFLSVPDDASLELGSSNFTLEFFVYMTAYDSSGFNTFIMKSGQSTNSFQCDYKNGTTELRFLPYASNSPTVITATTTLSLNTWYHICVTRSGNTITIYKDGTSVASSTSFTGSMDNTADTINIGQRPYHNDRLLNGYLSDLRLVNGTAITPASGGPTERLTAVTNTSLLTCHLPYIADGSSNAHSITVNGNTSTKPFGPYDYDQYSSSINGGSVYFNGSSDWLTGPTSLLNLTIADKSTEAATIEAWVYHKGRTSPTNSYHNQAIVGKGDVYLNMGLNGSGNVTFYHYDGTARTFTSTGTVPLNTWTHVAATISGGTVTLYINGSADATTGTWYGIASAGQNQAVTLGRASTNASSNYFNGYISDLRVIEGTATAPASGGPTAPLSAVTNTSLLISGTDAHVLDKSQNSNLKLVGNAAAVIDAPNNSNISSTNAVSFDGSGDRIYLDENNSLYDLSYNQGDFSIEGWFYFNSYSNNPKLYIDIENSSTYWQLYYVNGTGLTFRANNTGINVNTGSALSLYTWYHIALTREGSTYKVYVDGNSVISTTTTHQIGNNSYKDIGGTATSAAASLNGYIQDFRITKGLARHVNNNGTYTYPVPSAPLKG